MKREKWLPIKDYETVYSVSNKGRIKRIKTGRILKPGINSTGYEVVCLCDGDCITFKVHLLVFDAFGDGKRNGRIIQVDHKNENKLYNDIDNLQLLSNRENLSKYQSLQKRSSQYTGVYWNKKAQKWLAQIRVGAVRKYLGLFEEERKASLAYQKALKAIHNPLPSRII